MPEHRQSQGGHGLTRDEALQMIQGMDLHVTMDYIDGVWDAHDKNGDGVLDDEEFGTISIAF